MGIATVNPATGETIQTFNPLNNEEIEIKLDLAQSTFLSYRHTSMAQRSQWLKAVADILETDQQKWAKIMTLEMGKTLKSAIAEVQKCASVCRYYAENASEFLKNVSITSDASESYISYQPLGAILAVMPWNFPFWQVFRFAAPALMAGNVGLLKHASNVPQCALAIEEIFLKGGFPQGAFQTLLIGASQVSKLMDDDRIKAGTLTGSELAGSSFASCAGKNIKKVVLELGGSDPFIVFEDANLEEAVNVAMTARLLNNGQSCIAAKRFILLESIADEFEAKLTEKFKALKVGDPFAEDTDIGPLATPSILEDIDQQVQKSVVMGAKISGIN
jgi:succinate-semialdehyde dehydrogenase / glutarate-semialdehyde dehydrogenase